MRFITGPRQAGKTTLARQKLAGESCGSLYYLWDLRSVRNRYRDNELFFTADLPLNRKDAWICFDEIHKMPKWKNMLKGMFDMEGGRLSFIITGSAKLDLVKRAGDSLAGRYFTFRLMPLTVREVMQESSMRRNVPGKAVDFLEERLSQSGVAQTALEDMLRYGGFPEPFLSQSQAFYRKWTDDYAETVIREDLVSLTRITDRENVYGLYRILPEMAGSPVSENSLASHLQSSPVTVKNYLRRLEDFYLGFSLPVYTKNIKRSLLKARKFYVLDWAGIDDPAARFETFVACQLRARLMLWADDSGERFDLYYVRNRQKQETDFLLVRNDVPWLLVEVKLTDGPVDIHHRHHAQMLGGIPVVQVCLTGGIAAKEAGNVYRASAGRLLA